MSEQEGTPHAEARDVEQAMPAQDQRVEGTQLPRAASTAEAQVGALQKRHIAMWALWRWALQQGCRSWHAAH